MTNSNAPVSVYDGLATTDSLVSPNNVMPAEDTPSAENIHTEVTQLVTVQPSPEQSSETLTVPQVSTETISELDPEIRLALGDPAEDTPVFGENIHSDIAQRWLPILRKGLTKEIKEKLLKEHNVPDNCRLLKPPTLNLEIAAAVVDVVRSRDKKIEVRQGQLGQGITAISKAMSLLISDGNKLDVIKLLSEGCRILSDLHFMETRVRTKLITPCLEKSFLNLIQDEERDDTLFGNKLSEKIKAAKSIEKQGLQIKRNAPVLAKSTPQQQTTRPRQSGNWTNPPRYPSSANRGGRGGTYTANRSALHTSYRRIQPQAPTAPPPPAPAPPQTRQQTANRGRAPMRH